MSEYQYYEFRAIDRPLNREEMDELRDVSSRAEITPISFTNTYHWGNFKGDITQLMDRFFDAFVYVANWGTRKLNLRIPRGFLDTQAYEPYFTSDSFYFVIRQEQIIIGFEVDEDPGGDWSEGEIWMPLLAPIRRALMHGDLRALYLGWLSQYSRMEPDDKYVDSDEVEPPVPPGLGTLTEELEALADFLDIEPELLEVAAIASSAESVEAPAREEKLRWIQSLTVTEKNTYLLRFFADEGDTAIRAELYKRFRASGMDRSGPSRSKDSDRRTVGQLLALRDERSEVNARKAAKKAAKEKADLEQKQAEWREKHLDGVALREPQIWVEVDRLLSKTRQNEYDEAVKLLVDLRDVSERSGRTPQFNQRMSVLRKHHSTKPSLIRRFDAHQLGV